MAAIPDNGSYRSGFRIRKPADSLLHARQEVPVYSIKRVALLCLAMEAVVGCTANLKPPARSIQRDTAPLGASISEFLDLIRVDDLVYLFVDEEKGVLEAKFSQARAKSHLTVCQAQIRDEYFEKTVGVLDEALTAERIRRILTVTIQGSFTQRDIDALIVFYRTQSGKTIVAELEKTIRPYIQQRQARKDVIGADSDHDVQDRLTPIMHVFNRAAESHELSQFYGSDIDEDITSRLPSARTLYEAEAETLQAEGQKRLQALSVEYQAKMKAASTTETRLSCR
jgi:hypothetical protein